MAHWLEHRLTMQYVPGSIPDRVTCGLILNQLWLGLLNSELVGSIYRLNSWIHATPRARRVGLVLITHALHQCSFQQLYVDLVLLVPYPYLIDFLQALRFPPTSKISLVWPSKTSPIQGIGSCWAASVITNKVDVTL